MTRINNRSADLPTTFIGTHHAHPDHPDPLLCTVSWAEHQRGKWSSRVWNNCSRSKDVCWPCGTRFVQKHSTFTRSIALWTCKSLFENGCFALTNLRAQLAGYCLCRHLCSKLTVSYSLLGNQQPYIPPDERPSSAASSFESTYSRLKNSSPVISSPHTFPFFQCPVQTFCALTGNHPELRISVPVVLSGSDSAALAVENTASLFVVKTSIPTRLCSPQLWGGKGVEGHTVMLSSFTLSGWRPSLPFLKNNKIIKASLTYRLSLLSF